MSVVVGNENQSWWDMYEYAQYLKGKYVLIN